MTTAESFAKATDPERVRRAGMLRRMVITLTDKVRWQLAGLMMPSGREVVNAEAFTGIGIASRPPVGQGEAIVGMIGDASLPVILGVRDEKTRAEMVADLAPGETAIYTPLAIVRIKADGTIEARSKSGTAVELATKQDLVKLYNAIAGAAIVAMDGGLSLKTTILGGLASSLGGVSGSAPWPVGTTKFKAE
jgi:phage gp45-like